MGRFTELYTSLREDPIHDILRRTNLFSTGHYMINNVYLHISKYNTADKHNTWEFSCMPEIGIDCITIGGRSTNNTVTIPFNDNKKPFCMDDKYVHIPYTDVLTFGEHKERYIKIMQQLILELALLHGITHVQVIRVGY